MQKHFWELIWENFGLALFQAQSSRVLILRAGFIFIRPIGKILSVMSLLTTQMTILFQVAFNFQL